MSIDDMRQLLTGVSTAMPDRQPAADDVCHDISGRQQTGTQRGIIIRNGKKYLQR